MEIKIEAKPSFNQIFQLANAIERQVLSDVSKFWDICEYSVVQFLTERFQTENRGRWAPLSPKYKAWKEKHYPGRPILQLTQQLFKAATQKGAKGNIDIKSPTSFVWGVDPNDIPWAIYVQDSPRMPSRIWCELEDKQEKMINERFGRWLRIEIDKLCQQVK